MSKNRWSRFVGAHNADEARIERLVAERDDAQAALATLREQHGAMSNRLQAADAELAALRGRFDARHSDERFEQFVADRSVVVRQDYLDAYIGRLRAAGASEERLAEFRRHLDKTNHASLLAELFGEELLYTRALDPRTLQQASSFHRGATDLAQAARRGKTMREQAGRKMDLADSALSALIRDEDVIRPIRRVLEVGGAWGATITHVRERWAPEEYRNYEIDRNFARWAEREFGVRAMPVDGESLLETDDRSMDLVLANNMLFFAPALKVYSYLRDMARVTAPGGLVLFNVLLADRLDKEMLDDQLVSLWPRRAMSLVPERFVKLSFPDGEFELVRETTDLPGYKHLPYFLFRRRI